MSDLIWKTKLACRLHDPPRRRWCCCATPPATKGGTVADLMSQVFGSRQPPVEIRRIVQKADWWASAGDRPQFPRGESDGRFAAWSQVRFDQDGEIIHPTSGQRFDVSRFALELATLKQVSLEHHQTLLEPFADQPRRASLALWRFGPELRDTSSDTRLGSLWRLLPADTRVPDHTIWDHLDLTCAFGTAMAADENKTPALLTVSLGPVQSFIAQGRSVSDLWAGSHFLSMMTWEAIKVVCETYGPEQIIQPQLRGVPIADHWLVESGLPRDWFRQEEWLARGTDANPLFAATLPNRFTALVPAGQAHEIAQTITARVRDWVMTQGRDSLTRLLEAAAVDDHDDLPCHEQLKRQLEGFPEVHWSAASFSLVKGDKRIESSEALRTALEAFHDQSPPGLLGHPSWQTVEKAANREIDGIRMFSPNPGSTYAGLADLADRALAATKTSRNFEQLESQGWRDSLGGEREWITHDRDLLKQPPGRRDGSLWHLAAGEGWARKGEHLDAFGLIKRLWPVRFADQVAAWTGQESIGRFVVSTHAMALARNLETMVDEKTRLNESIAEQARQSRPVALPRRLAERMHAHPQGDLLKRLPDLMDTLAEQALDEQASPAARAGSEAGLGKLENALGGDNAVESYYALILMDGDRMGAWLNGSHPAMPTYGEAWHRKISATCRDRFEPLEPYLKAARLPSPAWHKAVSGALNHFAGHLAPVVTEELHKGRIIYAGGDDLLAMVSIDDLLSTMTWLRLVYAGILPRELAKPASEGDHDQAWLAALRSKHAEMACMAGVDRDWLKNGFVRFKNRLLPTLGYRFTASMGAVIAHKSMPLQRVLAQLRLAEQRAKATGRDAFAIDTLKRSGGAEHLTAHWFGQPLESASAEFGGSPMAAILALSSILGRGLMSRRAVYHANHRLGQLPGADRLDNAESHGEMLRVTLSYQFRRQAQGGSDVKQQLDRLAGQLVAAAQQEAALMRTQNKPKAEPTEILRGMMATAEFLARDGRSGQPHHADQTRAEAG